MSFDYILFLTPSIQRASCGCPPFTSLSCIVKYQWRLTKPSNSSVISISCAHHIPPASHICWVVHKGVSSHAHTGCVPQPTRNVWEHVYCKINIFLGSNISNGKQNAKPQTKHLKQKRETSKMLSCNS